MNILYLHGLDSKLSPEKREILEKYGSVYEPDINYYTDKEAITTILSYCKNLDIDVVIGSSMGGFAGYYVSNALQKSALLFNPALEERSVPQQIPEKSNRVNSLKHIVLGQDDEVINPKDTLEFLMRNFNDTTHLHLHLVPKLGHNIPVLFFEQKISQFLNSL